MNGQESDEWSVKRFAVLVRQGYSLPKAFYSRYDATDEVSDAVDDTRLIRSILLSHVL